MKEMTHTALLNSESRKQSREIGELVTFPSDGGRISTINYDRIILANSRNLAIGIDIPQTRAVSICHVMPRLIGFLWERADQSLE